MYVAVGSDSSLGFSIQTGWKNQSKRVSNVGAAVKMQFEGRRSEQVSIQVYQGIRLRIFD
jgi:hypothetical protein